MSFGAHALLAAVLGAIPPKTHREVIAITMRDTKKPPPARKNPPPDPEPPPTPAARPIRAKAAPPPAAKPTEVAPTNAQSNSSLGGLPDFGLSLSGGGSGGLAIPVGGGEAPAPTAAAGAKTLSRPAAPKTDECDDPPAKPRALSRPQPAYPEEARTAGTAGKVRVEITVDERGHVLSVRLIQGLGHGCDDAALAAARSMSFEPAVRCGKASAATFKVSFNFAPLSP
jgi:protein TonB